MQSRYGDIEVTLLEGFVAQVEFKRPPNNFFDHQLIKDLADCFDDLDENPDCRAILLCADGKHFCAGANFSKDGGRDSLPRSADARRSSMPGKCSRISMRAASRSDSRRSPPGRSSGTTS